MEINVAGATRVLMAQSAFISVKANAGSRLVSSNPSFLAILITREIHRGNACRDTYIADRYSCDIIFGMI